MLLVRTINAMANSAFPSFGANLKALGALPIDLVAPQVIATLHLHRGCLLVAPPGTGKTTRLPLHLLEHAAGRIVITEPRRAAARSAAARVAYELGERVGQTVGIRMRGDTKVSSATRIEFVTEGVFARMVTTDPSLDGISMILFDEVHERSLDSDLSVALALASRSLFRPELQVVLMSATLNVSAVSTIFNAPLVTTAETLFPVDVTYAPVLQAELGPATAAAIVRALTNHSGDILVFLPGAGEIQWVANQMARLRVPANVDVLTLSGRVSDSETNSALSPASIGRRKVILATSIAQTSLTIPGVSVVVDSGLSRRSSFDARNGMSRLVTERSSQATAIQRAGRAGREGPGSVIRLWSFADFERSPTHDLPEIADTDLTETVLTVACWGTNDPNDLPWLRPPDPALWAAGLALLQSLGALDASGLPTELGRRLNGLPLHPRLGAMLDAAWAHGDAASRNRAVELAVTLSSSHGLDAVRLRELLDRWRSSGSESIGLGELGARAFPERIAARTNTDVGRFQFADGSFARLSDPDDSCRGTRHLVALELDGDRHDGKIFRAVPIDAEEILQLPLPFSTHRSVLRTSTGRVQVTEQVRVGKIVVSERQVEPTEVDAASLMVSSLSDQDLASKPAVARLEARLSVARAVEPDEPWPDLFDRDALSDLVLAQVSHRFKEGRLDDVDVAAVIAELLVPRLRRKLDLLAPNSVLLGRSRRSATIDYLNDGGPTVGVRLHDLLGVNIHPTIGDGSVPLRLELLSPAQRVAATTNDLPGFWKTGYRSVRSDLRGRYPKQPWPDDPASFVPPSRS